jgi:hypothetical protein
MKIDNTNPQMSAEGRKEMAKVDMKFKFRQSMLRIHKLLI